jgi:hypothetical protein
LIPKKAKHFKKPTAEELNMPDDLVSKLIDFYWEKVRKIMSGLECSEIYILNFGTFKVKHWKIDEILEKHKTSIVGAEGHFAEYAMKMDLTNRIEKLQKIKKEVQERELKFKGIRDAREDKRNMEKQNPDNSGVNEQDLQEGSCGEDI